MFRVHTVSLRLTLNLKARINIFRKLQFTNWYRSSLSSETWSSVQIGIILSKSQDVTPPTTLKTFTITAAGNLRCHKPTSISKADVSCR